MTQTAVTQTHAGFKWELMIPSNIYTEIHQGRDWEPCVSNWIRGKLKEGDVAIDVGANIGWFSLLMSKCVGATGQVHAIEPEPSFRERLQRHIALNEIENIKVYRQGVSDQSETCWIVKNVGPYFSSATLARSYEAHENASQVHCLPLSAMMSPDRLDLIKIDIDGYELAALRGAQPLLEQFSPMIVMEIADAAPAQFLESLSYQLCRETGAKATQDITSAMVSGILTAGMPTINIFGVRT